jgi:DNA-binding CsgD family transcriptional regulator
VVEGLLRAGRSADATDVLRWVEARATRWRSPTLTAQAAHARAIMSEHTDTPPQQVEAAYERALALAPTRASFDYGRLALRYGAWLRRRRRPSQARAHLSNAEEALGARGALPWVDRARAELRATGSPRSLVGAPERRADDLPVDAPAVDVEDGLDGLTAQERQVVLLAAEGLSNRQIAERLSLSPRTVGSHLYKAFPKLGVSNRAQLRATLDRRRGRGSV